MSKLKIGIIGASGFIGTNLTMALESNLLINEIHLFSRSNQSQSINNIFYHKFDIKAPIETFPTILKQLDIIYLLQSESTPNSSWNEPIEDITKNVIPTLNLLKFIENSTVKKIIFTSSAGTIYGETNELATEEKIPNPFAPYAISKLTIENYLEHFRLKSNINYTILRISNVYGPSQKIESGVGLINALIENTFQNKLSTIYGDGSIYRNYIYIDDVALVLSECLKLQINESQLFNLCSDDNLNIQEVITLVENRLNTKINITYSNRRASDNPSVKVSNNKIKQQFKNLIFTPITNGINKTIESKSKTIKK